MLSFDKGFLQPERPGPSSPSSPRACHRDSLHVPWHSEAQERAPGSWIPNAWLQPSLISARVPVALRRDFSFPGGGARILQLQEGNFPPEFVSSLSRTFPETQEFPSRISQSTFTEPSWVSSLGPSQLRANDTARSTP